MTSRQLLFAFALTTAGIIAALDANRLEQVWTASLAAQVRAFDAAADYARAGHVDATVITSIGDWINKIASQHAS